MVKISLGVIALFLFVNVGGIRVPSAWMNTPTGTVFNVDSNRMNNWHDDPKRRHTDSIVMPYFPAADGRVKESKPYVGQRKLNKKQQNAPNKLRIQHVRPSVYTYRQKPLESKYQRGIQPIKFEEMKKFGDPYKITQFNNQFPSTELLPPGAIKTTKIQIPNQSKFIPPKDIQTNFYPIKHTSTYYQPSNPSQFIQAEIKNPHLSIPQIQSNFQEFDVPTRPIYSGKGSWAKPGTKHEPYIRPKEKEAEENIETKEDEPKSDGYEIYESGKQNFDRQKEKHKEFITKERNKYTSKYPKKQEIEEEKEEEKSEDDEDEFVPIRTYSQVRKYETEKHLPPNQHEPNLREVVKDSKIHTVYSEEGYEDASYDHGNEEKNAETDEKSQFGKNFEDSHVAGTMHGDQNYAHSQIIKTTELKDNGTGGMEYKVSSEMKVKVSPRVKYSKKKSRVLPVVNPTNSPQKSNLSFAQLADSNNSADIDTRTAQSIMSDITMHFKQRKKRHTNFNPDQNKYPYYNSKSLNKMSPLRFAENLANVPIKTEGAMTFYDHANKKLECEEVPSGVDPVPKDIEDSEGKKGENIETPRLKNLGNKIDCFKLRYFGENPLDSPFFQEELVEQPEPIFKELSENRKFKNSAKIEETVNVNENLEKSAFKSIEKEETNKTKNNDEESPKKSHYDQHDVNWEEEEQNWKKEELRYQDENKTENEEEEEDNTEGESNYNEEAGGIIEGSKLAEDLKNLFKLMQSPTENSTTVANKSEINTGSANKKIDDGNLETNRQPKGSEMIFDAQNATEADYEYEYYDEDYDDVANSTGTNDTLPNSLPLKMKKRRRRKRIRIPIHIKRSRYNPRYHPISVPINNIYPTTTSNPKINSISEVFYKDQIKPNEQLNVFADIINNIKNSTRDAIASSSNYVPPISIKIPNYVKVPRRNKITPNIKFSKNPNSFHQPLINVKPIYKPIPPPTPNRKKRLPYNEQIYEEYMNALLNSHPYPGSDETAIDSFYQISNQPVVKRKRRRKTQTNHHNVEILDDNLSTVGTVIPENENYQFNHNPTNGYSTIDLPVNKYIVPGMKPPPSIEKPFIYSDFQLLGANLLRRRAGHTNHRMKRSAARPTYSEIRRTPSRKTKPEIEEEEEEEDDDDDYVPHRPTNFHYDPKTSKIIYDKTTTTEEPTYIEVEYDEVAAEEKTTKKPKTITTHRTIYHKDVLNKENGPTIFDYITKLKADPNYKVILDPEPTTSTTTVKTTTISALKTTPPEFISFLEKLHKSDGYKKIENEDESGKKKKKSSTTTTEAAIIEEDEEEEEVKGPIRNSPGGQFNSGSQIQLFDISEYLPKMKSYTPRTSIDYSKYKTIERTTSRHNLSSRYNEEDDDLPLDPKFTNQRPITKEPIEEEESSYPEEVFSTTTTTTITTTTEKPKEISTSRVRVRGRKRPTTLKPTTTTIRKNVLEEEVETEKSVLTTSPATHRPVNRVYPRRPRPKIRLRPTTTPTPESEADIPQAAKRTQRKLIESVPTNHKPKYTPIDRIDIDPVYLESHKKPRLVTPDILTYNKTEKAQDSSPNNEINPRKLDVEVFKKYDKEKKHGGNYRREEKKIEAAPTAYEIEDSEDIKRLSDIVPKPFGYYSDPKLSSNINKLSIKEQVAEDRSSDYEYDDEVKIYFDGSTNKKINIIKDPSKRLYFYAPV